jgi:Protein of unknown function, DUF547
MNIRYSIHCMRRTFFAVASALMMMSVMSSHAQSLDHSHAAWSSLLKKHVIVIDGGKASQVRYVGMAADRAALKAYLSELSAVTDAAFKGFSKGLQMAFLINAYNAYTVELILTRYPDVASIKDLGSLLQSPWKKKIIPLLGNTVSLDGIEQDMLRARGRYDDPRIHFAVNCASIGCPPLREEAYVSEKLDSQLDEQAKRFLSDRSRNRWNPKTQKLEMSKIFDWYGDDFRAGYRGITSANMFYARYADLLADLPADRERIRNQRAAVSYLDYDWKLNDWKPADVKPSTKK